MAVKKTTLLSLASSRSSLDSFRLATGWDILGTLPGEGLPQRDRLIIRRWIMPSGPCTSGGLGRSPGPSSLLPSLTEPGPQYPMGEEERSAWPPPPTSSTRPVLQTGQVAPLPLCPLRDHSDWTVCSLVHVGWTRGATLPHCKVSDKDQRRVRITTPPPALPKPQTNKPATKEKVKSKQIR